MGGNIAPTPPPPAAAAPTLSPDLVDYRCPNGHRVAKIARSVVSLGPPERRCPQCGMTVLVPQYREWADMTPDERAKTRRYFALQTALVGSFLGFMIAMFVEVAGILGHWPSGAMALGALVSYGIGIATFWGIARLRVRASLARTAARVAAR